MDWLRGAGLASQPAGAPAESKAGSQMACSEREASRHDDPDEGL